MSSSEYKSYYNFSNLMIKYVINKLEGSHSDFKILKSMQKPSSQILIGNLAHKSEKNQVSSTRIKNNSMTVKFLLETFEDPIEVKLNFSVFYRIYPSFDQQIEFSKKDDKNIEDDKYYEIATIWKRKNIECISNIKELPFDEKLPFDKFVEEIKNDPCYFRGISTTLTSNADYNGQGRKVIKGNFLKNKESYENFLSTLKMDFDPVGNGWDCHLSLENNSFSQNNQKLNLIELIIFNKTLESTDKKIKFNFEDFIFNCKINIKLNKNNLFPFMYNYDYEEYIKNYKSNTRCLNCHADYDNNTNEITTKNYGEFHQKKIVPRNSIDGIDLSFKSLSDSSKTFDILDSILKKMQNHYDSCLKIKNNEKEHNDNLNFFKDSITKFNDGIKQLKSNTNALKSFNFLNESFDSNSNKYNSWRLFQIVFIISNIHDIVDTSWGNDTCELLHVMTGGGKSEAYFGLVLFSAFYDRLTGKKFGVTALTKFPLRMLSIQQLQRIATLFIHAEEIRLNHNIQGDPFSIAYFVGNSEEFPNHNEKIINQIINAESSDEIIPGRIIEKCPLCDGKVILSHDKTKEIVVHKCIECKKIFYLYFSDDEIYRMLPTFIICVVDKLATISSQRRVKNLLGGKLDYCPNGHGFMPRNDSCEVKYNNEKCDKKGQPVNISFSTAPRLIIQDEMHLIKESFGTIDSHFESLYDAMVNEFTKNHLKYITMTATVTKAKKQIEHLYHKETKIFPTELLNENNEDFFFEYIRENDEIINQRLIIGLKPNFRETRNATLQNLKYCSEFLYKVENNLDQFANENNFEIKDLRTILYNFKTMLSYSNKKADTQWLYNYINDFVNSKENLIEYIPDILTGDSSLDTIKETISDIENFDKIDKLLVTFATSLVSHGVDIDRWNIMIFQGVPRSTSEYIQALSRVGRNHLGIVFIWHYPNRTRDLSFYQKFEDYHNILNHKVEGTPISRWGKLGFYQTFTSIFTASILNYLSNELEEPIYNLNQFQKNMKNQGNKEIIKKFIKKAYISDSHMLGSKYYDDNISKEVDKRIKYLLKYDPKGFGKNYFPNALRNSEDRYFRTQFGMRGIQDSLILGLDKDDIRFYDFWGEC